MKKITKTLFISLFKRNKRYLMCLYCLHLNADILYKRFCIRWAKVLYFIFVLNSKEMMHAKPFQNWETRRKFPLQVVFGRTCFACWWYQIVCKISPFIGLYLCPIVIKAWIRELTCINSTAKEKKKGFHKARATRFQKKPNLDRFYNS